jgi:hypothetical protein
VGWYWSLLFLLEHCTQVDRPDTCPKTCDIICMDESVSVNGVMPETNKTHRCQAKECPRVGSLRSIAGKPKTSKWTYFMCDEHLRLLSDNDKKFIARTLGTKVA